MGMIAQFIDRACARRPDIMRRVLARPFGYLGVYVGTDEAGEPCGCLVGSTGLEAGAASRDEDIVIARAAIVAAVDYWDATVAGGMVEEIRQRMLRQGIPPELAHARTVALVKDRIARRLAEHDARVAALVAERSQGRCPWCGDPRPCRKRVCWEEQYCESVPRGRAW